MIFIIVFEISCQSKSSKRMENYNNFLSFVCLLYNCISDFKSFFVEACFMEYFYVLLFGVFSFKSWKCDHYFLSREIKVLEFVFEWRNSWNANEKIIRLSYFLLCCLIDGGLAHSFQIQFRQSPG